MLNRWTLPDIPHLEDFGGDLLHLANWTCWNENFDPTGKRIALIGGGSTGIQILPQIQLRAEQVVHFMKGNQWISPVGVGVSEASRRGVTGNCKFRLPAFVNWKFWLTPEKSSMAMKNFLPSEKILTFIINIAMRLRGT